MDARRTAAGQAPPGSQSLWMATSPLDPRPPLESNEKADVCVIGAGIAGLTTAYLLARAGRNVVVVDLGRVGGQETPRTTAHLTNVVDDRFTELERLHGEQASRLAGESHGAAIDRIEAIARDEEIDCEFERVEGWLFVQPDDPVDLDEELAAAHRAGLLGAEKQDRIPIDSFDSGPCLRFPRQGQFHPLKYLAGLCKAIRRDGGRIYGGTRVVGVESEGAVRVKTASGEEIAAGAAVVATNAPISERYAIHGKQAPYRTYVVALQAPAGGFPRALIWDTGLPYHYLRLAAGDGAGDLLVVGGEDHRSGTVDDERERYGRLEAWTRERFPDAGEVVHRWSGQVLEPADGLAFIGRMGGDNLYVASGDSGQGITHGTIAGLVISDLILGRDNPWAALYDPARKTLGALPRLAKESLGVAAGLAARITPGDPEEISRGCGAVVRRGIGKVAIYRDEEGALHERSAVCPHMGCVVAWNDAEKMWDCPCHGSRFDALGRVTHAPAIGDLATWEDEG